MKHAQGKRKSDGAALAAAFVLPPLTLRCVRLIELRQPAGVADLRGFLQDLGYAALLLVLVGLLEIGARGLLPLPGLRAAASRAARLVLLGGWTALAVANYEAIRALGGLLNLAHTGYAADGTFLLATVLGISHPWLFLGLAAAVLVLGLRPSAGPPEIVRSVILTAAALALGHSLPLDDPTPRWRQQSVVTANLERLRGPATPDHPTAAVPGYLPADLSGAVRDARPPGRPNVLLVILEGMSDLYLDGMQSPEGLIQLGRLNAQVGSWLRFEDFLAVQRQTNRGEYTLLCGDLPRLDSSTPKMSEIAGQWQEVMPCLPQRLHEAGYRTTYLQAATLKFMAKDRFMRLAGFREIHGEEWFANPRLASHWGVDDGTLFEGADHLIGELEREGEPWFLTLMTVGTHHAALVPPEFPSDAGPGSLARSVAYLDQELAAFLDRQEARDLFGNTVVIITSDESAGTHSSRDNVEELMAQAHGLCLIRSPGSSSGVVPEWFGQFDISLSIADHLGLATEGFMGRSLFRRYDTERVRVFGNAYLRRIGMVAGSDLHVCDEGLTSCSHYGAVVPNQTLGRTVWSRSGEADAPPLMRQVLALSRPVPRGGPSTGTYRLIDRGEWVLPPLEPGEPYHLAFSGQHIDAPPNTRVDVDIVFELTGLHAPAQVVSGLKSQDEGRTVMHHSREFRLPAGQQAILRYSFSSDRPLFHLECFLAIAGFEGSVDSGPTIRFREATLSLHPERSAPGGLIIRSQSP